MFRHQSQPTEQLSQSLLADRPSLNNVGDVDVVLYCIVLYCIVPRSRFVYLFPCVAPTACDRSRHNYFRFLFFSFLLFFVGERVRVSAARGWGRRAVRLATPRRYGVSETAGVGVWLSVVAFQRFVSC